MARKTCQAFTLGELLVSIAILTILILFVSRLFKSAVDVTATGNRHIDCDLQAKQVFDRMAVDFAQIIKRSDVDAYVKGLDTEIGNDKIAFFSQVPGYYPSTGSQSPTSLVAYRINAANGSSSFNKLERMGKGLLWNGVSVTDKALIFGATPTLQNNWATAVDSTAADADYETVGPQVFRFEYFYFLKDGTLAITLSANGIQDVAAISACIAVVDPKSKFLLSNNQLTTLAGRMNDFSASMKPGDLAAQWQSALDGTTDMPRQSISQIRLYQRTFSLNPKM
jgi:hypothetical protein